MKIICRPNNKMRRKFKNKWAIYYGLVCAYCVRSCVECATIDHLIPLSKGGDNRLENLVLACQECNRLKADKLPNEFKLPILKPIPREAINV